MPSDRPSSPANDELASNVFPHALGDIHFRMLVDAVQDYAIFMLDPDGRVASWNRGAQQLYGYDESEALGRVTHELLGTIHPAPWLEIGARLAAAGLHVPAVHAQDLRQGFLLIEDLGNRLYLPALNEGSERMVKSGT